MVLLSVTVKAAAVVSTASPNGPVSWPLRLKEAAAALPKTRMAPRFAVTRPDSTWPAVSTRRAPTASVPTAVLIQTSFVNVTGVALSRRICALSVAAWPTMMGPVPKGVPVIAEFTRRRVPVALFSRTSPPLKLFAVLVMPPKFVAELALLIISWVSRTVPSVSRAAIVCPAVERVNAST